MASKKEYDPIDASMYAWEKEYIYGCYNDVITLVYDRLVWGGLLPRKPSGLCVSEKFPIQYGVSYTRVNVSYDEQTYSIKLFTMGEKQEEFVKEVGRLLSFECLKGDNYVEIRIPMKWCGVRIDDFLKENNLPLEYANRLGFMQYPDGNVMRRRFDSMAKKILYSTWERFDLCSLLMTN